MPDRRPPRDVTRARLLTTAEGMFLARGYAATSVDAVAAEAGLTTGAIYSNFGGKADLFLAVLEQDTAVDFGTIGRALSAARTDEKRMAVFTAAIARDPRRWQARAAATIEFLSYARDDAALRARILAAQRRADDVSRQLVGMLCDSLGIDTPTRVGEITRDINALINGLTLRSLYDDELDVVAAISCGINTLLTGDRVELPEATTHAR